MCDAPLADAIARAFAAPCALLCCTMPRCVACELMPAVCAELSAARPALEIVEARFSTPADWQARAAHCWPRGVHPTRAVMPLLVLVQHGAAVDTHYGGAPAYVIDAWLARHLGPPAAPITHRTAAEEDALAAVAGRVAAGRGVKAARAGVLG